MHELILEILGVFVLFRLLVLCFLAGFTVDVHRGAGYKHGHRANAFALPSRLLGLQPALRTPHPTIRSTHSVRLVVRLVEIVAGRS